MTSEEERLRPHHATLLGLSRALRAEYPQWKVACIDIGGGGGQDPHETARRVFEDPLDHDIVALRDDVRLARVFKPLRPEHGAASVFRERGAYLILGGAGGLGFALSRHLARTKRARLAWIGRRSPDQELERKLAEIRSLGGEAIYLQADAADAVALERAVDRARRELGALNGAFHAAGVLLGRTLANLTEDELTKVFAPKVTGAINFVDALEHDALDLLVFFSSAASFVPPGGQANYAAASAFEDAFALDAGRRLRLPVSVINWGYWGSVGMVADDAHASRFAALGVESIEPAEGMEALEAVLAANVRQALVLKADAARLPEYGIDVARGDEGAPSAAPAERAPADLPILDYVKAIFADVLKCEPSTLGERETFENFGVDSLIGMRILQRFEADLGDLPSTLLFECITIEQLAAYFAQQRTTRLAALLRPQLGPQPEPAPQTAPEPVAGPPSDATPTAPTAPAAPPAREASTDRSRHDIDDVDDIAVIGVSGRYPQSPDLAAFWTNLARGASCVTEIPESRWDWRSHFDPRRGQPNRSYGKWGGFLEEIDRFDAAFFNILPRDAAQMDPQERLFLETCWNLLEEAGYLGEHTHDAETGVFVGVMYGSYGKVAAVTDWPRGRLASAHSDYWSLANRVSYFFDLHGPSYAVDSACSSSLTAVHLACEALRRNECRVAIAGGVNLIIHQAHFVALSAMNMLSTHPGCRVFDEAADGYVPGEGVGAVLLKPLSRALEDGDRIWAVIKSSFVNAGGKTSGYTVPNPAAQTRVITEALRRSGVHPDTITYVEAHGTGTELGDPIEVASLTRSFSHAAAATATGPSRAIGSVKANIGHLEGAAGIAGLTKVLLQLRHKKLAPSANLTRLNPKIDFTSSPFRVQTALADWEQPVLNLDGQPKTYPRRAGVSSFGAGGANAHVIVEEYGDAAADDAADGGDTGEEHLFLLSAKTPDRLRAHAQGVADFLARPENRALAIRELAYTSQVGRREMAERLAVRARTTAELTGVLQRFVDGSHDGRYDDRLFTGLASGKRADDLPPQGGDSATRLSALAASWVAGGRAGGHIDWRQLWPGRKPRRAAFPTYPFDRKRFWFAADEATTPLAAESVGPVSVGPVPVPARWRAERVLPADAFYGADHRVSGEPWLPGVAFLEMVHDEYVRAVGRTPVRIQDLRWVSPLKLTARETRVGITFEPRGDTFTFRVDTAREPERVLVRGTIAHADRGASAALSIADVRARCAEARDIPVFYDELARGGLDYGPAFRSVDALWIGADECLAHLVLPQPLVQESQTFQFHPSLMDGALQSISSLCRGSYVPAGCSRITLHLPVNATCWAHVREITPEKRADGSRYFDVVLADERGLVLAQWDALQIVPVPRDARLKTPSCRYLRPVWEPSAARRTSRPSPLETVLLITDDVEVRDALQIDLASAGARCISVRPGSAFSRTGEASYELACGNREDCQRLIEDLAARNVLPDGIIHAWSHGAAGSDRDGLATQVDRGFHSVLWLATAVLDRSRDRQLRLVFAHAAPASDPQPAFAAVSGALKTLALEHTRVAAARVLFEDGERTPGAIAERLTDELYSCSNEVAEIAYRSSGRWAKRLEPFDPALPSRPPHLSLRPGGAYLITGGAGVLGLKFAELLIQQGAAHVVLTGRSSPDQELQARLSTVASSERLHYHQADVSREADLQQLVSSTRRQYGPIHGVLHAAGLRRDARAIKKTRLDVEAVLAPKVMGTVHLDDATRAEPLDFFVLFSSVVAETGNLGQVDYAFANAFMNEFVALRELRRAAGSRSGRTLSICWPLWQEGGMTPDAATLRLLAQRWKMAPLSTDEGLRAFCHGLSRPESCFAVVQEPDTSSATPRSETVAMNTVSLQHTTTELARIESDLRTLASAFLMVDPADVDLQANLMELGFDSISLTELTNQVNERYGLSLLPTVLFERPNLAGLAAQLRDARPAAVAAVIEPPALAKTEAVDGPQAPLSEPAPSETSPGGRQASRSREAANREVAIIGMAGMLPKCADLDDFWRHLVSGTDLVTAVPQDRVELLRDAAIRDVRGAFLDDVGHFDAQFFGISPREASLMDPQQRIFLETVWQVIQDAGYRTSDLAASATGLFAGVSTSDYGDLLKDSGVEVEAHTASGIAHAILANRISYVFDLRGPSEAIDTACSSSLVAIHRAARAISDGECEMAIAGGVNVNLSPGLFTAFSKSGMLSPQGKCRTFDRDADGYVRGEGSGAVFLKPLDRALADGDHIHAVIKGSGINHGGRSPSLTAPNPEAQAAAIVQAFRRAGIHPASVSYIEAHGTGTRLGDPIEIEGLKKAFDTLCRDWNLNEPLVDDVRIAIGSVKTNIGHLEAAAGIAGVLKVLLSMQHRTLPGNLHFDTLNPHIRLEHTPFYINQQVQSWEPVSDGVAARPVRRAGISSFGFGGSNAHIVLEAFNTPEPSSRGGRSQEHLVVLSAPSADALGAYAERVARVLQRRPTIDLADLAFTLQVGRMELQERLAIVCRDRTQLIDALLAAASGKQDVADTFRGQAQASPQPTQTRQLSDELESLAQSWVLGAAVDWRRLHGGRRPRRISLPAFPLARRRHWFNERSSSKAAQEPINAHEPITASAPAKAPSSKSLEPRTRVRYGPKIALSKPDAEAEQPPPRPHLPAHLNGQPRPDGPALDLSRASLALPLRTMVTQTLGALLDLPEGELRADRRFADLGLDSIYRIELVRRLNRVLALDLKARDLYNYETVGELVAALEAIASEPSQASSQTASQAQSSVHIEEPGPAQRAHEALSRVIGDVVKRPVDPGKTFEENGFTSFDMLRIIALMEKQLGALRKTLLFDYSTLATLAEHLCTLHGYGAVAQLTSVAAEPSNPADLIAQAGDHQPIVIPKSRLHEERAHDELVADLERRHGKESGLPSRDIAPLLFIGVERKGYFHISVREDTLFAWSYVGASDYFSTLAHELVLYADARGLKPSLLSMIRLTEAGGKPFTATPFGAVQRLWNLAEFTLKGQKMQRLRYIVNKFERSGRCRAEEYRSGSDAEVDRQLAGLIDQWCQTKSMVNPYMSTVRREILGGTLKSKHRVFLTYLDDVLVAAVVITRIVSESGYGLDLEFYSKHTPLGAIDWTIVQIIEQLVREGFSLFSFGGTWGVKICDSPNADAQVAEALEQMRSTHIFNGEGNLQFKNKFRPENTPIYLCRPAGSEASDVSKIVLMIADPSIAGAQPTVTVATVAPVETADQRPPAATYQPAAAAASAQSDPDRERALSAAGYNPLKLPHHLVEFDLLTDSWSELDARFIPERIAALAAASGSSGLGHELATPSWLPFRYVFPAMSGRSAEAALCSSWPKRHQVIVQNSLFPTWALSQVENDLTPFLVRPEDERPGHLFRGNISIEALEQALAEHAGRVAFVALELSVNAIGGYPIALANLKRVRAAATAFGVPLVLDATRILENAWFIAEQEPDHAGEDVWKIAHAILALADTATFSLSKDFGVNVGGLVATNDPQLIDRLHERTRTRGLEIGLSQRRLISAALADQAQVAALVKARMLAVRSLWEQMNAAGIPVVAPPSGHCVLLEVDRMERLSGLRYPVQACLAWIYRHTGIRAGAHLAGKDDGALRSCIRLAVPVGLGRDDVQQIANRLTGLFRSTGQIADLIRIDDPSDRTSPALGDFQSADAVPPDEPAAVEERLEPRNDNIAVVQASGPAMERRMVTLPEGEVELFIGGAGPTLLLIHPFNIGAGFFAPQYQALSSRFRVVAAHAPGVGSTRVSTSDFSFPGLARLSMRILRELGVATPVHVMGASFGGVTAQAFALEYPDETASLTLLGSSYKVGNRPGEYLRLAAVARADLDGVIENTSSERLRHGRFEIEELLLRCESMDPRTGLSYLEEFAKQPDFLTKLPSIAAPTLIVHGRFDRIITRKTAHLLHGSIPDARYEEITEAGHFPSLTSSEEVNRILLDFLATVTTHTSPSPVDERPRDQVVA